MEFVPMILTAVSTVLTVAGQIREGRQAKNVGWHNAKILERQGDREFAAAQRKGLIQAKEGELAQSAALARAAAGGAMGESTTEAIADLGAASRYDQEVSLYEGLLRRQNLREDATMSRWQGSEAKRASQMAALTTVVKGASSMASLYGGGSSSGGGGSGGASGGGGAPKIGGSVGVGG
jgi:uncharacterized membrane protein YgcG